MSSMVTPFNDSSSGGIKKPKLTEINEYTITGSSQTRTYSKTFANGGFVIITGKDGFLAANGYGPTTSGDANYYMGSVNTMSVTNLVIDNITIPSLYNGVYGTMCSNVLTAFGDYNFTTCYYSNQTSLSKNLIITRYVIPVKTSISMTYKISHNASTSTEGRFVFYKFDYQTN